MTTSITSPNNGDQLSAAGFGQKVAQVINSLLNSVDVTPSADYTLTTSEADVTNASAAIVISGANAFALVMATALFNVTVASAGTTLAMRLSVDGAIQTREIEGDGATVARRSHSTTWKIPLAAGSHTLKLRALKSAAGVTANLLSSYTVMTIVVFDLP